MALRKLLKYYYETFSVTNKAKIIKKSGIYTKSFYQSSFTKQLTITSKNNLAIKQRNGALPLVAMGQNRPLVILLTWIEAKQKHVNKFVDLYLKKGFDVLTVSTRVWEMLRPTSGIHVTAASTLDFLHENVEFQPVIVHSLSVGCVVWAEVMVEMAADMKKYRSTINRVKGIIYESMPPPPQLFMQNQASFGHALFPNNATLSSLIHTAAVLYLNAFGESTINNFTKTLDNHYNTPVKIPTLQFISKDDPIANFDLNMKRHENWSLHGIQSYVKWWEHSPHVGHFIMHQEEYLAELNQFLKSIHINNKTD